MHSYNNPISLYVHNYNCIENNSCYLFREENRKQNSTNRLNIHICRYQHEYIHIFTCAYSYTSNTACLPKTSFMHLKYTLNHK